MRVVDPETGAVLRRRDLLPDLFGEGLALHGGVLYQGTCGADPALRSRHPRPAGDAADRGRDWGLASDGRRLVVSDGSAGLRFIEPSSWAETGPVEVYDDEGPVEGLNELEMVQGRIWANIYPAAEIVVIDPATGQVEHRLDLSPLARQMAP